MGNEGKEKWTAGPWINDGKTRVLAVKNPPHFKPSPEHPDYVIAQCMTYCSPRDEEMQANVDLLSAAPDLAKAAEFALSELPSKCTCHEVWCGRGLADPDCRYCEYLQVIESLREALAKARGGENHTE